MKTITIAILVGVGILGVTIFFLRSGEGNTEVNAIAAPKENNVTVVDEKQIIMIDVRGGYQPQKSIAKAGVPTVIRFNTANTFDCSSSIRIPSMKISKVLPSSGATDIDIGINQNGVLEGSCSMGMYRFAIEFVE